MIEKLTANWTSAIDVESIPDILNSYAKKINEIIDALESDIEPGSDEDLERRGEQYHHYGPDE